MAARLEVPFDVDCGCFSKDLVLPATYQLQSRAGIPINAGLQTAVTGLSRVEDNTTSFYASELDVSRLNVIHEHLWLAGLERPARPLHQQVAIGRDIVVTESADLHLLWGGNRIYVKPMPDFLLSHSEWMDVINQYTELHERASGFLLSYIWLICHRSDLRLAHEHGLLPKSIDWKAWTAFSGSVSRHLDWQHLNGINVRYRHGELRLARINWIYRLCSQTRGPTSLLRGYLPGHYHYESFIGAHLGWLVSAIAYAAVVLTAMQVGLATDELQSSSAFQRASYGFTVFSILAPVIAVAVVLLLTLLLVIFNARYTFSHRKDWSHVSATEYAHNGHEKAWQDAEAEG